MFTLNIIKEVFCILYLIRREHGDRPTIEASIANQEIHDVRIQVHHDGWLWMSSNLFFWKLIIYYLSLVIRPHGRATTHATVTSKNEFFIFRFHFCTPVAKNENSEKTSTFMLMEIVLIWANGRLTNWKMNERNQKTIPDFPCRGHLRIRARNEKEKCFFRWFPVSGRAKMKNTNVYHSYFGFFLFARRVLCFLYVMFVVSYWQPQRC
jgi:hypothetical protein